MQVDTLIEESIEAGMEAMFEEDGDVKTIAMNVAYAAIKYFLEQGFVTRVDQEVEENASATLSIQD